MKRPRFPRPIPPPEGKVLRRGRSNELEELDIKMIEEYHKWRMKTADDPHWRNDPSYFWRRK